MTDSHEHAESHGHSTAAWTGVVIILVGTAIMAAAVLFPNLVLFIVGTVISVLGGVATKVLSMAGYGDQSRAQAKEAAADGRSSGTTESSSGIA